VFSIRRSIKARELRLLGKESRKMAAFLGVGVKKNTEIKPTETSLPNCKQETDK
jgi:hypothetical protein